MFIRVKVHWAARTVLLCSLTGILLLTGCSSLSEKECRSADWRMIGYEDGISGKKLARLTDHRSACAQYDIAPNLDLYRLGYEEGLDEYCRPGMVFELGKNGSAYPTQCPDHLSDQLKTSYRYGRDIYDLNDEIRHMQKLISNKNNELIQAEQLLSENKAQIIDQGTTVSERDKLLEDSMQLSKRIDGIKEEIDDLNIKLKYRKSQLKRLVSVLQ